MGVSRASYICARCALQTRHQAHRRTFKLPERRQNSTVVRSSRPFRVAIVGSGPAGFYAASRLLKKIDDGVVDMYEQLPVPFGLVRYGVAPDHPEVKNCEDSFTGVAASPRFNFIGNIGVGSQLPLQLLKPHYDAILFAYGAVKDRELGIPGERAKKNVLSARAFVGWYNGLPEYHDLKPDLTAGEHALVVGQGNVALDVARILLTDIDELRKTDIAEYALEALSKSRIKRVRVAGRRGPMQAAFTIKEVRELLQLPQVSFDPIPQVLLPPESIVAALPRAQKRLIQLLAKGSPTKATESRKSWSLDFLLSPHSLHWSPVFPYRLSHTMFTRNDLDSTDPFSPNATITTHHLQNGEPAKVAIPTNIFFRSIGYKSMRLPGFAELGIEFDDRRGVIPHDGFGRIVTTAPSTGASSTLVPAAQTADSVTTDVDRISHLPGLYVAGWVKRGPTGVIASTMMDAFATADSIAADYYASQLTGGPKGPEAAGSNISLLNSASGGSSGLGWEGVRHEAERMGLHPTSWQDWQKIDAAERARGKEKGKIREKFGRVEEMLEVIKS